jgi:hypothetical protein
VAVDQGDQRLLGGGGVVPVEVCVSNHVHHDLHETSDCPQWAVQIIPFRTIGMTAARFGNAFERLFAVSEPLDVFPAYVSGIGLFTHGVEH